MPVSVYCSGMRMIAAGIDLGSNTFRLLVARIEAGRPLALAKELITVRLGQGLGENRRLSTAAMGRGLAALARFREIIAPHNPQFQRACGTAALRLADNRTEFLRRASITLGLAVEIIDGEEEARLGLTGVLAFLPRRALSQPLLVVDVGGGSTELVLRVDDRQPLRLASLPLGAVGLTETFLQRPLPPAQNIRDLTEHIEKVLSLGLPASIGSTPDQLLAVATGGTATSLAALDLDLQHYDETLIQDHLLAAVVLDQLWQRLVAMPVAARNLLPSLGPGRGDIILAGLRIYQVLLRLLAKPQMMVSDAGLLEGITLSSMPGSPPG